MNTQTCESCRHFLREGDASFCRRYPPTVQLVPQPVASPLLTKGPQQMQLAPTGLFPPVRPEWTCGEFSPKDTN